MKYVAPLNETANSNYSNGNTQDGTLGSIIPAQAIEHPMREIINVISESGLTPSGNDNEQLYKAIRRLCAPAGEVKMWAGQQETVPDGFLFCDGRAISRTQYADLFAIIGTYHGEGNGSSTFNVPDLRDRFVVGRQYGNADRQVGDTGGAWKKSFTTNNSTVSISGSTDGHALTENEMPSHKHRLKSSDAYTSYASGAGYTGSENDGVVGGPSHNNGTLGWYSQNINGDSLMENTGGGTKHDHDVNITSGNHNHTITNMDVTNPYYCLCYMIRT